ncbi:hypothetical protein GGR53DRAFT_131598 [Hypoxylon sp. FL1150]|nr:hypothetical protein GGR53DRAFT_131598 [Hypoxylon sp. FL1150]
MKLQSIAAILALLLSQGAASANTITSMALPTAVRDPVSATTEQTSSETLLSKTYIPTNLLPRTPQRASPTAPPPSADIPLERRFELESLHAPERPVALKRRDFSPPSVDVYVCEYNLEHANDANDERQINFITNAAIALAAVGVAMSLFA